MHSVFLALPLEQEAKWQFQAVLESLKPWEEILGFQSGQTPHLTLQFWQEAGELELKGIREQAAKIASKSIPFDLRINGADTFSSHGEDRVLFLTVHFSPELAALKKQCPWDTREPFRPHITVARPRHPQRFNVVKKKVMKELEGIGFTMRVDRLRLYGEIDGRKQTPVADFLFGPH